MSTLVIAAVAVLAQVQLPPAGPQVAGGFLTIDSPCPRAGAHFGAALAVLDFNGDGQLDLAVGAWGEGLVYVIFGPLFGPGARLNYMLLNAGGVTACGGPAADDSFGYALAAGQLDDDAADELVVGAPAAHSNDGLVYVFGLGPDPLVLSPGVQDAARYGNSVKIGDLDGDGDGDLAIAAPRAFVAGVRAGVVYVEASPLRSGEVPLRIMNPAPTADSWYGQDLAITDKNGDGQDDLFVSAIFNTVASIPFAGEILYYQGPLPNFVPVAIRDPFPNPLDLPFPRFGMDIEARGDLLAVGANRKDHSGVLNAGQGFLYRGANFAEIDDLRDPLPEVEDLTGFRTLLVHFVGDSTLDVGVIVMRRKRILVWDGAQLDRGPRVYHIRPDSGHHWANGYAVAQLIPGGFEEIVLGSLGFGTGVEHERGRVVIYHR